MKVFVALLALCLGVNRCFGATQTVSKCGTPQVESLLVESLRVVGGAEATYGSHPWLVSLQKRGSHFCGGAIISDRWILTAAHCIPSLSKDRLADVRVVAGEFDQRRDDEEQQVFAIKTVSVHEKYHHAAPMTYDIALIEVDQHIRFGVRVNPICLPFLDESISPGTGCVLGGWGRIREKGRLPAVLREVQLDLVEPAKSDPQRHERSSLRLCSVKDGPLTVREGVIRNPAHPGVHYDNNQLCVWTISVPPGFSLLLEFDHFDLEDKSDCRHDRLTVSAGPRMVVGRFCGSVPPGRVLMSNSQNATLLFSSDINQAGSGFVVRHRALWGRADPGCGAVVLVKDPTVVHSPRFPQFYSHDCAVRWVIYAPIDHVVKLDFETFDLEESDTCLYDSLAILGDVEGTEEIAVLCGSSVPPPVLSYHSLMVLHFTSDSSVARRGFHATVTFISHADLHSQDSTVVDHETVLREYLASNQQHVRSHGSLEAAGPAVVQSSSRILTPLESPEDPREHVDDGDYSGKSSGRS